MTQDILDKFLKEVSYKFPKGYPDMEDPQDVNFLNELVMQFTETYKPLKFGDLTKKQGARLEKVADLINDKHPFTTVDGEKVPLEFDLDSYVSLFSQKDIQGIKALSTRINQFPLFKDSEGNKYTIDDLVKTPELGGKGQGSGTQAESLQIEQFNKRIQEAIKENGGEPITIKLGGEKYEGITHVENVPGNPKADCTLNAGTVPKAYISLKVGTSASKIQQYGGLSTIAKEGSTADMKEALDFVEAVKNATGGEMKSAQSFSRPIESDSIKRKSIYGKNQGSDTYGLYNCQALIQGNITLQKQQDGSYEVKAHKIAINPEIPDGEYEPYYVATFRTDRNNEKVKNARFGIYPKGYKPTATPI